MLTEALKAVAEFHVAAGVPVRWAGFGEGPENEEVQLRLDLIKEETQELDDCITAALNGTYQGGDLLQEVADALADIIYVALGAFHSFGIDGDSVFEEVHRSNMTKFPTSLRADGKVLKGPNYEAPRLDAVLTAQVLASISHGIQTSPYLPKSTTGTIPAELTGEEVQLYIDELRADGAEIEDVACILENFGFTVEVHVPGCEGDCGVDAAAKASAFDIPGYENFLDGLSQEPAVVDLTAALKELFERYPELEPDPAT